MRILSNPVMESAYYTVEKHFWAVTADDANTVIPFIVFAAAIATRKRVMLCSVLCTVSSREFLTCMSWGGVLVTG